MTILQKLKAPTPEKMKKLGNLFLVISGSITAIVASLSPIGIPMVIVSYIAAGSTALGVIGKLITSLSTEDTKIINK